MLLHINPTVPARETHRIPRCASGWYMTFFAAGVIATAIRITPKGSVGFMLVHVLNHHGKPLMPCSPARARHLLKDGKAKVVRRDPFTIKLLFGSSGYTQDVGGNGYWQQDDRLRRDCQRQGRLPG